MKLNIYDFTPEGLLAYLGDVPAFRAEQITKWLYSGASPDEMTNVPKALRERLKAELYTALPRIDTRLKSRIDGTVKYLFRMEDGAGIESVVMPYSYGSSICVSSQAGCRMGCAFCASTVDGLDRNLTAGEMMGQVLAARRDSGQNITHIVIMGSGEPLDNYENVLTFIRNAISPKGLGLSARHITLSTCGLIDGMKRLSEEGLPINLAISLHAPNDTVRKQLMPVARSVSIETLLAEAEKHFEKTHRRVTLEYALIRGVNDSAECARELAERCSGKPGFHVNLIPVNSIEERSFRRSSREVVAVFLNTLIKAGVQATVRRKMGADIDAACGQLRRAKKGKNT
ncbi:MAG: 23S rRNA (adenine(2503)-C(2))-methyltransferase RlmN [Ruminococcaceae bacterium]|nr:23S rRNA (adenine(2503)-C(2))-methyltransferase RlmN [Oscillospiraceae bacterium]